MLFSTIFFGVIYPGIMTLFLQVVFPEKANGSLIVENNTVLGSTLIGQSFSAPEYFWSRPSATDPYPYNAQASNGSNLSPANPALLIQIKSRINALQAFSLEASTPIPIDLVTASASGLDPHISVAAAYYQVERVARARQLDPESVRNLVTSLIENRQGGLLGEPRVNVVKLNLALSKAKRSE